MTTTPRVIATAASDDAVTSEEMASVAASYMQHEDSNVRAMAASLLRQHQASQVPTLVLYRDLSREELLEQLGEYRRMGFINPQVGELFEAYDAALSLSDYHMQLAIWRSYLSNANWTTAHPIYWACLSFVVRAGFLCLNW